MRRSDADASGDVSVECVVCFLRQTPSEEGLCRRCGAALPGARAASSGGERPPKGEEKPPEPPPSRPAAPRRVPGPPGSGPNGLLELDIDIREEEQKVKKKAADDGAYLDLRAALDGPPPAASTPPKKSGKDRLKGLVPRPRAIAGWLLDVWEELPRPSALPMWARWELGLGIAMGLLVLLAFLLHAQRGVAGDFDSEALQISLTFPDSGWYRVVLDDAEGTEGEGGRHVEGYRNAAGAEVATALLWMEMVFLDRDNPYGLPSVSKNNAARAAQEPLDPGLLRMDGPKLFERALSLNDIGLELTEDRGCTLETVATRRGARCRALGVAGESGYELDLFAFGTGERLFVALLATRIPFDETVFTRSYSIIASVRW